MGESPLERLGLGLERTVDALRRRLSGRAGAHGPLEVVGFRGHGTPEELRVGGRVLEDRMLPESRDEDSALDNLMAAWRRFGTAEASGVEVRVAARGVEVRVTTDGDGCFRARLRGGTPPSRHLEWEDVEVVVPDDRERGILGARTRVPVRVPSPAAAFGVVSDIDDTVLRTGATDLLRAARNTLLENARTRLPFPGVAAFYRALVAGPEGASGGAPNPLFYVSASPWNLYELLVEFLERNGIPDGPLFLRDAGLAPGQLGLESHREHKLARIGEILELHRHLPVVLLGDSGQHDVEIYRDAVGRWPGRVRAIYIRDVSVDARDRVVVEVAEALRNEVDLVLVRSTLEAAEHAVGLRLVAPAAVDAVARAVEEDEAP